MVLTAVNVKLILTYNYNNVHSIGNPSSARIKKVQGNLYLLTFYKNNTLHKTVTGCELNYKILNPNSFNY